MFQRIGSFTVLVLFSVAIHAQSSTGGKPILKRDAAIEAIMVPSDDVRYADLNPAVHAPRVVIRNEGSIPLDAISIQYGTEGFPPRMFAWNGRLATGSSAEVQLPHLIDMLPGENTFTVKLGGPNGKRDKDPTDNTMSTRFTSADMLGNPLQVRLRTPAGNGGWMRLESTRGPVLFERKWSAHERDSVIRETIQVPSGNYMLQVVDSSDEAHAHVLLSDGEGVLLKQLEGKAKKGTMYQFHTGEAPTVMADSKPVITLSPDHTSGRTTLDYFAGEAVHLLVVVKDEAGAEVWRSAPPKKTKDLSLRIDLRGKPMGRYTVLVFRDELEMAALPLWLVE